MENCTSHIKHISRIALISFFFFGRVTACEANGLEQVKKFSKDYKAYPAGTPEAVLTTFVEADLGDVLNRDNDDRYFLWWNLTEVGGVSENDGYLKLYVKSYRITNKMASAKEDEVILHLDLDVRAIRSSGNPKSNRNIDWRTTKVIINNVTYFTDSEEFIESVFGMASKRILKKETNTFVVKKTMNKWVFPVRMVKKAGRWVIGMESLPFQTIYVDTEIDEYAKDINRQQGINYVCQGKRKLDNYVMEGQLDYVKEEIGNDSKKFRAKFCSKKSLEIRSKFIDDCNQKIELLKTASED